MQVAKTKALISFAVVFAYKDCCFSDAADHIKLCFSRELLSV